MLLQVQNLKDQIYKELMNEVLMNTKQKTNWWIDTVLFIGFITTFFLDLTGVEAHQWIGILSGALAAYHLLIKRTRGTRFLFGMRPRRHDGPGRTFPRLSRLAGRGSHPKEH